MRELYRHGRRMLDEAAVECQRARRNLADASSATLRRCAACGRRLSMYADPRDRYCAPCHPRQEARPGADLVAARWRRDEAGAVGEAAHDAAVELRGRRGRAHGH